MYKLKGTTCLSCGLKATHWAVESTRGKERNWHLNLYGMADGVEVLFTKDHIIPKAKGGKNGIHNLQPMCRWCNFDKGDRYEYL